MFRAFGPAAVTVWAFGPAAVTVGAYEPDLIHLVTYPWALGSGSRLTGDLGFTAISMRTPPR
jgi:hypothetical protein